MAAAVPVLVAATVVSLLIVESSAAKNTETLQLECVEKTKKLVEGTITKPGATVKLTYPFYDDLLPGPIPAGAIDDDKTVVNEVYTDVSGTGPTEELKKACPGATGKRTVEDGKNVVNLVFPQLPNITKTIYFHCKKPNEEEGCGFELTLKAPPPEGPQACAVGGTSVNLGVPAEGSSTRFFCGSTLKLNPHAANKVYKEDCATEEDLKDLSLTTSGRDYVLTATKKPPKKTICYLCKESAASRGRDTTDCAVMIALRGSSRLTAQAVFGVALPCVLSLIHFS